MSERKTFPCISVRQPWAWALLRGKTIENRSWATRFRGLIAIHAGLSRVDFTGEPQEIWSEDRQLQEKGSQGVALDCNPPLNRDDYPFGAIVGVVDLYDCVAAESKPGMKLLKENPWAHDQSEYFFMVRNPLILPEPIPCKGALGIMKISDPAIVDQLDALVAGSQPRNLLQGV